MVSVPVQWMISRIDSQVNTSEFFAVKTVILFAHHHLFLVIRVVFNPLWLPAIHLILGKSLQLKHFNVGNEDSDSSDVIADDSEVIADDNETSSFMASNHPKVASSSKGGGGRGKSSLYERWKEDYDDNPYDDSKCEDLIEEQLTLCDAYMNV
ncbi:hypothetical protein Tco_1575671 [Tanacetum coccineum]